MRKIFIGLVVLATAAGLVPLNRAHAAVHSAGTNVSHNGTVYMVGDGERRAYTSGAAFLSYGFNSWANVSPASSEDLSLPEGSFIPPRDGKIICSDRGSDKGTCYLVTNSKRSAFVSAGVFVNLGFSFSKVLHGDVSFLEKDSDITNATDQHKPGVLINHNGTISLISSNGLMGIPSPDVLKTWGYSFEDAISANASDSKIPQSSVISAREGAQLRPNDSSTSLIASEQAIFQGYIDAYPDLPTEEIDSPDDVAAISTLYSRLDPADGFEDLYPHLSSDSTALLNKLPALKNLLQEKIHSLYDAESDDLDVRVFEGGQKSLVSQTLEQSLTDYSTSEDSVLVKESGIWKFDLVGSVKVNIDQSLRDNPRDAYFTGSRSTNLSIEGMEYENGEVTINDPEAKFLVQIANNGRTTVHKFYISLKIGDVEVYSALVQSYKLRPDDEIILSLPIASFWKSSGALSAGIRRTDLAVGFDPASLDEDLEDNYYYIETNFK